MGVKFLSTSSTEDIQESLATLQTMSVAATPDNARQCSTAKGIYFWYLKPTGLEILSQNLPTNTVVTDPITEIGDYILVYVGTAGARKTANNQGHIRQRMQWHICTRHDHSKIKNGTLSTLRTTLGCLLCNHLLSVGEIETELVINDFMNDYLRFTYIEYQGDPDEVIPEINADEKFLIESLKPLLNIKNNPNAKIKGHSTNLIKMRRRLINSNSKQSIQ